MILSGQPYRQLLVTYLKPQRSRVICLAITLLSGIGLQVFNPQILRYFIDTAIAGGPQQLLVGAATAFMAIALIRQILEIISTYFSETIAWTATNDLRLDLTQHCLKLDLAFHKTHTPGELVERVDGDVDALSRFFSQFVLQIVGNGLLVIGVLGILWIEDWRAGLSLSLFAMFAFGTLIRLQTVEIAPWRAYRQISAEFYGFVTEHLSGLEDIRANDAVGYVMTRLYRILRQWLAAFHKARFTSTLLWGSTVSVFTLGNAIALAIGAYLWSRNAITIGTVYLIFYYATLLREPVERIRQELEQLQQASASFQRIQDLLTQQPQLRSIGQAVLSQEALSVQFEGVWFGYEEWGSERKAEALGNREQGTGNRAERGSGGVGEGESGSVGESDIQAQTIDPSNAFRIPNSVGLRPSQGVFRIQSPSPYFSNPVLQNLTFHLPAGQVLGLLGRTGSGKSTLARLLLRLYDVQQGQICLGGVDIAQMPLDDLPRHVGFVTQDVQLFQTTVRNNLTFFDPHIPDSHILQSLEELNLLPWLQQLPQGLDTELGADSGGLSAGQAQLLAFARVFLKNPGLVILDEASSRLDPETEQVIEQAVDRLLKDRTGIIIAHRLKTLERADQILILEQGQMVEYGDRATLINNPQSRFSRLSQVGIDA